MRMAAALLLFWQFFSCTAPRLFPKRRLTRPSVLLADQKASQIFSWAFDQLAAQSLGDDGLIRRAAWALAAMSMV